MPEGWSFITVSHKPDKVAALRRSVAATVGDAGPWELLHIDGTTHDLFRGYNAGARSAAYDRLVFVHHDVELLGNSMALEAVRERLDQPAVGVVGVIGVRFLLPSGTWWGPGVPQEATLGLSRGAALHEYPHVETGTALNIWPPGAVALFGRVIVLDGLFLALHRRTFDRLGGFDEQHFRGFHFYDIDLSFRAHLAGLENHVVPFPVKHASRGDYDQAWETARLAFVSKHARSLPASLPADNVRFA